MSNISAAFFYDPDFRREPPREGAYCHTCQRPVNVKTAVAVSVNEETWMAIEGHGNHEAIRTNFAPQCRNLVLDAYIGTDCYKRLIREKMEKL